MHQVELSFSEHIKSALTPATCACCSEDTSVLMLATCACDCLPTADSESEEEPAPKPKPVFQGSNRPHGTRGVRLPKFQFDDPLDDEDEYDFDDAGAH